MSRQFLSIERLKDLVLAEIGQRTDLEDVDRRSVVIHPKGTEWVATLKAVGPRIDEALCAAVTSAGALLAKQYGCSE
jgi:hypothetical protein